ncbi:MAG: NfeD family protein [Mariprofundaceae bacterium]|nr:NfeD family protein [Mariprofundaceae bacterium]
MDMFDHWHIWLIIAFIILIVELISGTYFLLALAGGALLTSLSAALIDLGLSMQLFVFAISSALCYVLLLSFKKDKADITDGSQHMLGQQVEVLDAIEHRGRVRYKGVVWQAESPDKLQQGDIVEIISVNGSTLGVKSLTTTTQGAAT